MKQWVKRKWDRMENSEEFPTRSNPYKTNGNEGIRKVGIPTKNPKNTRHQKTFMKPYETRGETKMGQDGEFRRIPDPFQPL